ncbi:MAG: hypothetical protein R3E76_00220 [Planctomycetota bacterium]
MPEQAILDLPVIEFELYEDSLGRLHAQCIESYGLAGFRPHPDAIFHLAASLWRYRETESMKQVAGLAAFYLHALSNHVAARRRVAAVRTAMQESGDSTMRARLADADDALATAQEQLTAVSTQLSAFVASLKSTRKRNPKAADERLKRNLSAMGEPGWTDHLELVSGELAGINEPRIDWSAPLDEVLEDLEALPTTAPKAGNGNGHGKPSGSVLERLQAELEQYRTIADRASTRLKQVDDERHQLEALLQESEHDSTNRSVALEEAREALEVTLVEARDRLDRLERDRNAELLEARRELKQLRSERDRLAGELLLALESSTEVEVSQEELIERLESAVSDRAEAAQTLSALSRRLEEVQNDAVDAGDRVDALTRKTHELQQTVEELASELAHSEEQRRLGEATIRSLENNSSLSAEFESILTESEDRLADTQERLADAELRIDQLGGQLEDKDYELQRAQDRIEGLKKTIDSVSVQLAEAETLGDGHEVRIGALERENERLRRDLSDAQTKMLDATGDVDEAKEAARAAESELARLKESLEEERTKTTSVSSESMVLRKDVRDRDEKISSLQSELEDTQHRLERFEKTAEESTRKTRDIQDELDIAQQRASTAEEENQRLRSELDALKNSAAVAEEASTGLQQERESLRAELQKAKAAHDALQSSVDRNGGREAELRAALVQLEQEIALVREEQRASNELAEDRRTKLEEKLVLAAERAQNADTERSAVQEMYEHSEKRRAEERRELEALVERERKTVRTDEGALDKLRSELEGLREKLNESEAFLIKRQREFERTDSQLMSLLDEVRAIADLRVKYEKTKPGKKRDEVASQIGRRMDSLFSSAGRPVHADRRTEKLVIMTIKKSDEEIAEESNKPFVATNKDEDQSNDSDHNQTESAEADS